MTDHDQLFKELLREFLSEFFEVFLPKWAARLAFDDVVWHDKEVLLDAPTGERLTADAVVRVGIRPEARSEPNAPDATVLGILLEFESGPSSVPIRARVPVYRRLLERRHDMAIVPVVVFLRVGLAGVGVDSHIRHVFDFKVEDSEYLYVGLPGLSAEEYLNRDNPLAAALSVLMKSAPTRKAWLAAEALRLIAARPLTGQKKFLLGKCVETYSELTPEQMSEFENQLLTNPYREARTMKMTGYDLAEQRGELRGKEQGLLLGESAIVMRQLDKKFGPLPAEVRERIGKLTQPALESLADRLLTAASLEELGLRP